MGDQISLNPIVLLGRRDIKWITKNLVDFLIANPNLCPDEVDTDAFLSTFNKMEFMLPREDILDYLQLKNIVNQDMGTIKSENINKLSTDTIEEDLWTLTDSVFRDIEFSDSAPSIANELYFILLTWYENQIRITLI